MIPLKFYASVIGVLVLLLALLGGGWYAHHSGYTEGAASVQAKWDTQIAQEKVAAATQQTHSATVTTQIITKYVPQIQVVHEKGATIVKQVPIYVPQSLDSEYRLPIGFVRLHDAAAAGMPLPTAASSILAEPSAIGISATGAVIAGNYELCRTEREKYAALWQWAEQQAEAIGAGN